MDRPTSFCESRRLKLNPNQQYFPKRGLALGCLRERTHQMSTIRAGRDPGLREPAAPSWRRLAARAARVARAREVGDRKLVGALVRDGVEPVVVAQCVDHDPADRLRHLGRHGLAARLVPRAPRRQLGRAAARGVVRFRPLQLEYQPQLEQRVVDRLVEPVVEPRVVLVPAPAVGRERRRRSRN